MTTELIPMRADQIEEVADLLTRNFLSNNPIWKTFQLDNKEVYKFFVDELKLHLDSQEVIRKEINPAIEFNMVYFHDGKLIAAGTNFELYQYLKIANSPAESQTLKHFQVLQSYGKRLFDSVKIQEHERGKHIYGSFIAIDEHVDKQVKKAFRNKSLLSVYKRFLDHGFKSMILRTFNILSQKIYLSLGAKIISEVQFELKNQKFELKLLGLQFNNPIFSKMIGL